MSSEQGSVCMIACVPQLGFRPELLSPVDKLNRSASHDRLIVSRNSAFTPTTNRDNGQCAETGLEKSCSSASVVLNTSKQSKLQVNKPTKMDSFHELHIDIPINKYLSSEPNSSTITPSPKPDKIPEFELSPPNKPEQFFKSMPFVELASPASPAPASPKKMEFKKSAHFKEILLLFQNAAHVRQAHKRLQPSRQFKQLRSRFDSRSLDESSDRSGSDSSLSRPLQLKMPRSTTVATASKTQTRTLITEHFSSEEEDRGIVKDIVFQNNQRIPIERKNTLASRNTDSLLSVNVKDPRVINRLSSTLSTSMYSPQSNKTVLHSPASSIRSRTSDGLFHQIATSHSSTLAYVSESFPKLLQEFSPLALAGRESFDNACLSNLVFKSTTPILVRDKIALFDAGFVTSNYVEHPVTVLISSAGQYAPLLGRHAERSGFGTPTLAEFEELEIELRHFLQESGFVHRPMTTLRIVVMPPMNVCSLQSLAAHYLNKNPNVNKCEEQVCFIMIQLLSALKCLQSDGVEQLSNNFKEFVLSYINPEGKNLLQTIDQLPRLMLLKDTIDEGSDDQLSIATGFDDSPPNIQQTVGICKFALRALCTLLNRKFQGTLPEIPERTCFSAPLRKCAQILNCDKTNSMSEAKQLLEFAFFSAGQNFESEYEAKLWLDEKRAQFVNQLVRWLIQRDEQAISPRQQIYLYSLLSSTPRGIFKTCHQLKYK